MASYSVIIQTGQFHCSQLHYTKAELDPMVDLSGLTWSDF